MMFLRSSWIPRPRTGYCGEFLNSGHSESKVKSMADLYSCMAEGVCIKVRVDGVGWGGSESRGDVRWLVLPSACWEGLENVFRFLNDVSFRWIIAQFYKWIRRFPLVSRLHRRGTSRWGGSLARRLVRHACSTRRPRVLICIWFEHQQM